VDGTFLFVRKTNPTAEFFLEFSVDFFFMRVIEYQCQRSTQNNTRLAASVANNPKKKECADAVAWSGEMLFVRQLYEFSDVMAVKFQLTESDHYKYKQIRRRLQFHISRQPHI
jgi:hypothetical protein